MVNRTKLIIGILIVGMAAGAAAAAVTITELSSANSPNDLSAAEGNLNASDFTIDSASVTYSGLQATDVTIALTNTGSVQHDANVNVALVDDTGTSVSSGTDSVTGVGASTSTTVTISVTDTRVDKWTHVEVLLEQTA